MKRRQFIQGVTYLAGGAALAACSSSKKATSTDPDAAVQGPSDLGAISPAYSDAAVSLTAPAWLKGHDLYEWFEIPGTVHAGSPAAPTDDPNDPYCFSNRRLSYSGMALRDAEIILAACGGHGDYSGNEVTSVDLSVDAPAWQLRSAASAMADRTQDMAYYADGKPSSRHTYWSHHYSETRKRVMLHRSRFVYGSGVSFPASNGFDLAANAWDPAGTWSDGYDASCQDSDGNVWATSQYDLWKWTAASDTWTKVTTDANVYAALMCFDNKRNQLFSLVWGDGQADGSGVNAYTLTNGGTTRTPITFNANAAYAQFQIDMPAYAGMEYDTQLDSYVFCDARPGTGRIYLVKPNDTTTWDMNVLQLGPNTVIPPQVDVTCSRFRYIPAYKGFVLMALGSRNVFFIRTA